MRRRAQFAKAAATRIGVTLEEYLAHKAAGLTYCRKCDKWLGPEHFYAKRCGWCRPCRVSASRIWHHANPEKVKARSKRRMALDPGCYRGPRLARYGLTRESYDEMFRRQGGKCAICGKHETAIDRRGKLRWLAVDHCHTSGSVRALLCSRCNLGIGSFGDSASILDKAAAYIRRHQPDLFNVRQSRKPQVSEVTQ